MSRLSKNITTQELMSIDYRYNYTGEELLEDYQKLKNTTAFKKGAQFKPGMKLCQHFFPNFWNIKNSDGKSFHSAWNDYKIMDEVREWGLKGMSNLWLSWIRRAVYMRAGLPNSSFYRPHLSKQVCIASGVENGTMFDPCMGWGGRLLGAVSNNWNYVGCDPNLETFTNIQRMTKFISVENKVRIHNIGAENFDFSSIDLVDAVLTSPPYFNLEIYTADSEQSYNKHSTYIDWRNNWYVPLIEKCLSILKDTGISAWNVMSFDKNDLIGDLISTHEKNGWKLIDTLGFDSPIANIRKVKNKDLTYLFKKM